jgi:dolichol-phosphate mannosyltransferase
MAPAPELTVVVPSYNERGNVALVMERVARALGDTPFEVLFVDDLSPDGTAEEVRRVAALDPRCRLISRCARGLSGAALEGMLSAQAPVVALLDADLQHDEALLQPMLERMRGEGADLVVASRHATGGSDEALGRRHALSSAGATLARGLLGVRLTDPMSGFFMVRRALVERVAKRISPDGFKILLDLVTAAPRDIRIAELAYRFRPRAGGASKLDAKVALEFAALLASKLTGGLLPLRFVMFCFVGGLGLVVHLAVAWLVLRAGQSFIVAQSAATVVAMTSNFFLNNAITHRDRALRGGRLAGGLLAFYAICSFGVVANVGFASVFFGRYPTWWLAALAGALVGTVWNYAISATFVWRSR